MSDRTLIPGDSDLWRRTGSAQPACTADACRSGRDPCPCPESCQIPDPNAESEPDRWLRAIFWRMYLAALLVGVAWGVAELLPMVLAGGAK